MEWIALIFCSEFGLCLAIIGIKNSVWYRSPPSLLKELDIVNKKIIEIGIILLLIGILIFIISSIID